MYDCITNEKQANQGESVGLSNDIG